MSDDPAELIFYRDMTTDRFFEEAERQGVSLDELHDEEIHDRIFRDCLLEIRTDTVNAVAAKFNLVVTGEQARSIARNSLVPEVIPDPAPLTPEEREIATELYFHAVKAAADRYGEPLKDRIARTEAHRMAASGERGLTPMQKLSRAVGCLVVVGMLAFSSALTVVVALVIL